MDAGGSASDWGELPCDVEDKIAPAKSIRFHKQMCNDWPLSSTEKKTRVIQLFDQDLREADKMIQQSELALESTSAKVDVLSTSLRKIIYEASSALESLPDADKHASKNGKSHVEPNEAGKDFDVHEPQRDRKSIAEPDSEPTDDVPTMQSLPQWEQQAMPMQFGPAQHDMNDPNASGEPEQGALKAFCNAGMSSLPCNFQGGMCMGWEQSKDKMDTVAGVLGAALQCGTVKPHFLKSE